MKDLGFRRLVSDTGLFIKYDNGKRIVVVVYIDNALFCGLNKAKVLKAKQDFMSKWECRDLGDATDFLHMQITRKGNKLSLDQVNYLDKILDRFGMVNSKPARTPLPEGYQPLANTGPADSALWSQFQQVIGSLLYIMLGTRPDIAFAVTKLAQQSANPTKDHLSKAKYILAYLNSTRDYTLDYNGKSGLGLVAFVDLDWRSDPNTQRSQTGFLLRLAGGTFSWISRMQKTVAYLSTDAEYMALSDCSRQVVWVRLIFKELNYSLIPIEIASDNQGAIFNASNPVTEKRLKHINIRYHYIRELVETNVVRLLYIQGVENAADILTKNLGHTKFSTFWPKLGLSIH
jgi:hypothetical protein